MGAIFLDQISTIAHEPIEENEAWRNNLIQAVTIPDIDHLSLKTKLTSRNKIPICCPDGSMTRELRNQIERQVRRIPLNEINDTKYRKANTKQSAKSKNELCIIPHETKPVRFNHKVASKASKYKEKTISRLLS